MQAARHARDASHVQSVLDSIVEAASGRPSDTGMQHTQTHKQRHDSKLCFYLLGGGWGATQIDHLIYYFHIVFILLLLLLLLISSNQSSSSQDSCCMSLYEPGHMCHLYYVSVYAMQCSAR